jgi:CRISPR-associated helicase Cas3/CRISPR-associated endonuclease Cas3-HD
MTGLQSIWAKSPRPADAAGEPLTAHLAATLSAAGRVQDRVGELPAVPQRFWAWVSLAALLHDAGKVADGFQVMVGNGPGQARPWGERHEVLSLGFVAGLLAGLPEDEQRWVALGVLTHHRPLTGVSGRGLLGLYSEADSGPFTGRFGRINQDAARGLMSWLAATASGAGLLPGQAHRMSPAELGPAAHALLGDLREVWRAPVSRGQGRTAVLLQGAVTLADHLSSASASAGLHSTQPVGASHAASLAARLSLHEHQQSAANVDGHLLLRAPTGTGKTEAAQLWAARQVESMRELRGGQPRIFYTLPYLASINAMTARLGADLGDPDLVGVAHSRAALYHLDRSLRDDDSPVFSPLGTAGKAAAGRAGEAAKAVSRAAATRLFRELVRVGTPYQLLRGALAGAGHSSILIDSANSVFILDELHAYDTRRLGYILAMAGFWEQLGGRIAVISATFPQPLAAMLSEILTGKLTVVEALDRPWPVRHRLTVSAAHLTSEEAVQEIGDRLRAGQAVLVTANNIADARTLFGQLGPVARGCHGDEAADLLHSRFRSMDRRLIEERIRDRYGTGRPRKPGLVVATQVIEVSLDVDFDALHSSGAPLEALIQRFGRVNRVGERPPADVVVHAPGYRTRRGSAAGLWADGVYESGPAKLAMEILARHDGAELSERHLAVWLDEIYGSAWGEEWRRAVTLHQGDFDRAFLGFGLPFDDREDLAERFDKLFDGTEAILESDKPGYTKELNTARGRAGRLLGSQYLIPLPRYAFPLGRYDRELRVMVIDADYDPRSGLGQIHGQSGAGYQPGEVL